ncbi:MAG: Na+:solute symporter [Flavobacteriales bacterium]|nr:Na+:solute symporter [Flavobacteriales bacterium]
MQLTVLDWVIIGLIMVVILGIGMWAGRKGNTDADDFFLGGRKMPWWLLGTSMVATTFSADTPNLVTDLVRQQGVSGNWAWWAFLLTGMVTVFVYARLWRRSGVLTDIAFYELRYGGKAGAYLRGFRALYLGLVFNVLVMATVSLAAIKLGSILLGWPGWLTLLVTCSITLLFSVYGGLKAILWTDLFQFFLAMGGAVAASVYVLGLPEVGGIQGLMTHPNVMGKLSVWPDFNDPAVWVPVLLVPLAVQWWASYYPGAEPGGGGYIAQRMFSAKSEDDAVGATLLFNAAHYALRPWPWILVALASLIVFPDLDAIAAAFPQLAADKVGHDVAYPAMLSLLPAGLLGWVAASLLAAFISTMSTQVNLGASYLVHDGWVRFFRPDATEAQKVTAGRWASLLSLLAGALLSLSLTSAAQAFNLLLLLGAGTGGLFILRWFWWRISASTEIVAMAISLAVAVYFTWVHDALAAEPAALVPALAPWAKLVAGSLMTTAGWVLAAYFLPPESEDVLQRFVDKVQPGGPGWKRFPSQGVAPVWNVPRSLLQAFLGCLAVYGTLLGAGAVLFGDTYTAAWMLGVTAVSVLGILKLQSAP